MSLNNRRAWPSAKKPPAEQGRNMVQKPKLPTFAFVPSLEKNCTIKGKKKQGNAWNNLNVLVLAYTSQSSFALNLRHKKGVDVHFCRLLVGIVPAVALHTALHSEVEISSFL